MKKQLLFAFAVLGVQQSQAVSGAVLAVMTGDKVMMVENIDQIPQIPATVSEGDKYSVKCNGENGKPMLANGDTDGVTIRKHQWGNHRCKITFNKAGTYKLKQEVNGKDRFQHVRVVEGKSTSTKAKRKAEKENRNNQ